MIKSSRYTLLASLFSQQIRSEIVKKSIPVVLFLSVAIATFSLAQRLLEHLHSTAKEQAPATILTTQAPTVNVSKPIALSTKVATKTELDVLSLALPSAWEQLSAVEYAHWLSRPPHELSNLIEASWNMLAERLLKPYPELKPSPSHIDLAYQEEFKKRLHSLDALNKIAHPAPLAVKMERLYKQVLFSKNENNLIKRRALQNAMAMGVFFSAQERDYLGGRFLASAQMSDPALLEEYLQSAVQ